MFHSPSYLLYPRDFLIESAEAQQVQHMLDGSGNGEKSSKDTLEESLSLDNEVLFAHVAPLLVFLTDISTCSILSFINRT